MQNEIVKVTGQNIIRTMDDAERAAKAMALSGFFPDSKSAAQAVVKIMAGQELGFGAFASMTGVAIIQGKPAIGANLLAAAIKRTGKYNYRVTKHSDKECEITFYEGGQVSGVSSFSWADAEKAGLAGKDNWKKYPRNMLFARALSNGQRWYAPDVFNGATVYTPDEMGASVDDEGNAVIEAESTPVQQQAVEVDPEESYNKAKAVMVNTKNGERFMGELTKEQLDYVIEHGSTRAADAARIVMEHDFQMEGAQS